MIANEREYQQARTELQSLEQLLAEMLQEPRPFRPDLELLSVRRLVARLHEELGQYESAASRPMRDAELPNRLTPTVLEPVVTP